MADENIVFNDNELEPEEYIDKNPTDEIYVLDGRGRVVKMEVEDDVSDD